MALADRWLLPDGIKEMLPPTAHRVERLRRDILDLYNTWGYDLVMPPLMEHLDSLLTGVGKDLDLKTFKLVDQLTGQALGIRADITPQVARIDAHCMRTPGVNRLCYSGSVLHTHAANMLASRNPLQVGAELYGHSGMDSDLEIISLMLETLFAAGIKDQVSLDLGHVGIFRALVKAAGLSDSATAEYMDLLNRKALPELQAFIQRLDLEQNVAHQLIQLPRLNGDQEVLTAAKNLFAGEQTILDEIDYLEELALKLSTRYPSVDLYFDLSELRGYNYHTGVVFAALTPVFGQAIAKGGRYDEIGKDFGRARPATGFSADLKTLADIVDNAKESQSAVEVFAPAVDDPALLAKISELRAAGKRVVQQLSGGDAIDIISGSQKLEKQGESWVLVTL